MRLLFVVALGVSALAGPAAVAAPVAGVCAWQAVTEADRQTLGRFGAHPHAVAYADQEAVFSRTIRALNGCGAVINGDPGGRVAYNYVQSLATQTVLQRELLEKGVDASLVDRLWAALPAQARDDITRGAGDADMPLDMLVAMEALPAVEDAVDAARLDPSTYDAVLGLFVARAKLAVLERWEGG